MPQLEERREREERERAAADRAAAIRAAAYEAQAGLGRRACHEGLRLQGFQIAECSGQAYIRQMALSF